MKSQRLLDRHHQDIVNRLSRTALNQNPPKKTEKDLEEWRKKKEEEQKTHFKEVFNKKLERFQENHEAEEIKKETRLEDYRYDLDKKLIRYEKTRERLDAQKLEMKRRMMREEEVKKAKVLETQ